MEEQGTLGVVTRLRLTSCPAGHILIRSTDKPGMDDCMPCIPQTYSLETATYSYKTGLGYLNSDNAAKVVLDATLCLPCPAGATCNGADRINAKEGFWRGSSMMCPEEACDRRNGICDAQRCMAWNGSNSSRRYSVDSCNSRAGCRVRPMIYRCLQTFCPSSSTSAGSTCKEGHKGPLCSLCEDGWAMAVRGCENCDGLGAWQQVVLIAVGISVIWIMVLLSWRQNKRCEKCNQLSCTAAVLNSERFSIFQKILAAAVRRLTTPSAAGYFKILLSFWQLTNTYTMVYNVQWPTELSELWSFLSSLLRIDILEIPSVSLEDSYYVPTWFFQ